MAEIMDLVCCETVENNENKAYEDPALLEDRVLDNLLRTEDRFEILFTGTCVTIQVEVTKQMRKVVSEWMMEVRFDPDLITHRSSFHSLAYLKITRILDYLSETENRSLSAVFCQNLTLYQAQT